MTDLFTAGTVFALVDSQSRKGDRYAVASKFFRPRNSEKEIRLSRARVLPFPAFIGSNNYIVYE